MRSFNIIHTFKSTIEVEVEGYFVERYINLCRSGNIEIWDIKQLTVGKIRFITYAKNLKKMKNIIKKSRCKLKIVKKNGIYFKLFKYRKRRVAMYIFLGILLALYIFTKFIWCIKINGNLSISQAEIMNTLKEYGVYPGAFYKTLDKGKIADALRAKYYNIAWVGVEINGINLELEIIEKNINSLKEEQAEVGNIVANRKATVTNIVAINGTPLFKKGEIVNAGDILIEGKIYYTNKEPIEVHASGMVKGIVVYEYAKEYDYEEKLKEYTNNKKMGISFYINEKEFEINYLPKGYIYDITKHEKKIKLFGNVLGVSFNQYQEYTQNTLKHTREEIINIAKLDFNKFITETLGEGAVMSLVDKMENIEETETGIKYTVKYYCEEDIGEFVKKGNEN